MTEAEALAKMETAFPGAACTVRNDGRMVWFEIRDNGKLRVPGLAFRSVDKVDHAIACWKRQAAIDAMLAEVKGG